MERGGGGQAVKQFNGKSANDVCTLCRTVCDINECILLVCM